MLKQRVLTALVLVPLAVWGILALPTFYLGLVLALFVVVGAWEWAVMSPLDTMASRLAYVALVGLSLLVVYAGGTVLSSAVLTAAGLWWVIAIAMVLSYRSGGFQRRARGPKLLAGIMVLVPAWLALTLLHAEPQQGPRLVLFLMVLIWSADIGAFFAGRQFGRHKLAPQVSPGKSWEGVAGGAVLAGVLAYGAGVWFGLGGGMLVWFVLLSLITVFFSVVGDLTESLIKRDIGVKDSGRILPGHGGVLDRIDSLTAAAPIFALGMSLLQGGM